MRKLLYLQYFNPGLYPSLEHSSTILAEEGWQIRFFGVGALGDADAIDLPPHRNIRVTRVAFVPAGWRQKVHYVLFALRALWIAFVWRPAWIYVSDPFACPVALVLSAWPGWRILYHEHDTPDRQSEGWRSVFARLIDRARIAVARRAAACVVPGEARKAHFESQTGTRRPVLVVWNCPSRREMERLPREKPAGELVLFYHGTLVPSRLPIAVIHALARSPGVTLRFAGYETIGHIGYVEALESAAKAAGVEGRVQYLGAMNRKELLSACSQSHVGLSLLSLQGGDLNVRTMVGPSNKAFDYLACGLALVVPDQPEWKAAFVASGYGVACDPADAQQLAATFAWLAQHRQDVRDMGERGRSRMLEEWNYETQFEPVARLMREAVS